MRSKNIDLTRCICKEHHCRPTCDKTQSIRKQQIYFCPKSTISRINPLPSSPLPSAPLNSTHLASKIDKTLIDHIDDVNVFRHHRCISLRSATGCSLIGHQHVSNVITSMDCSLSRSPYVKSSYNKYVLHFNALNRSTKVYILHYIRHSADDNRSDPIRQEQNGDHVIASKSQKWSVRYIDRPT